MDVKFSKLKSILGTYKPDAWLVSLDFFVKTVTVLSFYVSWD